jgi:MoxR-like ATPase
VEVIHPRFEALDLLYRVDVIARLADAQVPGALDPTNERYVKKGRLWEAMILQKDTLPSVLLIDEIDKADSDVPNALLEVLGNRSFSVPLLNNEMVNLTSDQRPPLVVITTNEERELPAAFIRRCVVLNQNPPKDETKLMAWLIERGRAHNHLQIADGAREHAAQQVLADRKVAKSNGYPPVGLAEYIDLLTALDELTQEVKAKDREAKQMDWIDQIGAYALVKHADQAQDRKPEKQPSTTNIQSTRGRGDL